MNGVDVSARRKTGNFVAQRSRSYHPSYPVADGIPDLASSRAGSTPARSAAYAYNAQLDGACHRRGQLMPPVSVDKSAPTTFWVNNSFRLTASTGARVLTGSTSLKVTGAFCRVFL